MPYIYSLNPSARSGYGTRSVFNQSLTGLNSELSFSTGCYIKVEEPRLPYYLAIAEGRFVGFILFLGVLTLCENANSLVHDLNSGHHVHFSHR